MRLIGRPDLLMLARCAGIDLRGAVLAFAAELEEASWQSADDARAAFPLARFTSDHLIVDLAGEHCAVIAISYEKGVALIVFAGPSVDFDSARAKVPGKKA